MEVLTLGPDAMQSKRSAALDRVTCLARQLEEDGSRLHQELHPDIRAVVKGRRLLLFRALLRKVEYQDDSLFSDIV